MFSFEQALRNTLICCVLYVVGFTVLIINAEVGVHKNTSHTSRTDFTYHSEFYTNFEPKIAKFSRILFCEMLEIYRTKGWQKCSTLYRIRKTFYVGARHELDKYGPNTITGSMYSLSHN